MPEVIVANIDCGGCYEVPDYTRDLAVCDNIPRHLLLFTQVPAPGTLLTQGIHPLTITVTDPSGNKTICTKSLLVQCQPTFVNTEQTAECPAGQTGDSVTIPAGSYSGSTQDEANAAAQAAAEAQLVCCDDNAAFIAGNMNSAVYDPVRDVIWGTGTPGHILKFDATTGALISNTNVFGPDWSNDATIAYCPETDRLYTSVRASFRDSTKPADKYLYEIHPDTLAITNSKILTFYSSRFDSFNTGFIRLYSANGLLILTGADSNFSISTFLIDPTNLASFTSRQESNNALFGDVCYDDHLDRTVIACSHDNHFATRYAARVTPSGLAGYTSTTGTTSKTLYGVTWCQWNNHLYAATATQYVEKLTFNCDSITEINLGRPNANAYCIRYNPYDYYLYVPNRDDNTVAVISPVDDSFTILTGFDAPYDVVCTPTRTFAVQHSREGLKLIATLPTIPAPTPDPPDPAMVKRLLSYYALEETTPGPWLDSKGSNHMVPGPGVALNGSSIGTMSALAIDAGGKILGGGQFTRTNGVNRSRLARFNASGTVGLDSTFVPATTPSTQVLAIAVQADTKVVVGGTGSNALVRMDSAGVNDGGFTAPAPNSGVFALAIQSGDQKIIAGGAFSSIAGRTIRGVERLTTAGANDTTWNASINGVGNSYFVSAAGTGYTSASGVGVSGGTGSGATFDTVDDGGGGIASVTLVNPGSGYTAGDVLTLAGGGGDATVTVNNLTAAGTGVNSGATVTALAIDAGGNILIAGTFTSYNDSTGTTLINRIARILPTGKIDTSFNPGTGADQTINAIAIDGSGKIIIGGSFTTINGTSRLRIARLNTDGSLDTSLTSPFSSSAGAIQGIVVQTNGKIVVTGGSIILTTRLNTNGTIDATSIFGANAIAIQTDQKIVLTGSNFYGPLRIGPPCRLNADFTVDTTFNPGAGCGTTAGINGNCAQFNSTNPWEQSIANITSNLYLDPRKGWTVTYWIKETATGIFPPRGLLITRTGSTINCGFDGEFTLQPLGVFYADGTYNSESLTFSPTVGVWYFVRAWVDPADRKLRYQVTPNTAGSLNGTIQASPDSFDRILSASTAVITILGASSVPVGTFIIDELAIYEGALSDADAAINYGGGAPPAYAGVYNP